MEPRSAPQPSRARPRTLRRPPPDFIGFQALLVYLIPIAIVLPIAACTVEVPQSPSACPPIVNYSAEVQRRAADDLERLPPDSSLVRMMGDYAALRDMIRACGK